MNNKKRISAILGTVALSAGIGMIGVNNVRAAAAAEPAPSALSRVWNALRPGKFLDEFRTQSVKVFLETLLKIPIDFLKARGWLDLDLYTVAGTYCDDLTVLARKGKLKPAICREIEMKAICDALLRSEKANCVLLGEAGVGKTAVMEGFAWWLVHGENVPQVLRNKTVLRVNTVALLAGKSYNSEHGAMGRLRALLEYCMKNGIILCVDEFHQWSHFADLLKTYTDRGQFSIIAATTPTEFGSIAKDPALERRFTRVMISEPTKAQTFNILKSLREKFENSEVTLSDEVLLSAIDLTDRYMRNRNFPDKAIGVVDSACRAVHRAHQATQEQGASNGDATVPVVKPCVTIGDIQAMVATETNIPIGQASTIEEASLNSMEERLGSRIKGQSQAIKTVSNSIRKARFGTGNPSKPRASFLFAGCSGVGKTALAEALGEEIGNIVRVDISQLRSRDEFVEKIWKRPYSVLVFDGIENSSHATLSMILGILENGYTTDDSGKKVDFSNTIIVITSNIGEDIILKADANSSDLAVKCAVQQELMRVLGNRFVNRVGDVIVFNKLTKDSFKDIIKNHVKIFQDILDKEQIKLHIGEDVIDAFSNIEINHSIGAHQVARIISEKIEGPLVKLIVEGTLKFGNSLNCKLVDGDISFEVLA